MAEEKKLTDKSTVRHRRKQKGNNDVEAETSFPVCLSLAHIYMLSSSTYISCNHTRMLSASNFSWQLEKSGRVLNVLDWNAECEQRLPTTQAAGTSFSFFPLSIAWIFMLVHKTQTQTHTHTHPFARSLACPSNFYMFSRTATVTFFFSFGASLPAYSFMTCARWNGGIIFWAAFAEQYFSH